MVDVHVVTTPPAVVKVVTVSGGGGGTVTAVTNTYIQLVEPTPTVGSGPFIWYQINALGTVIDIRKGVA